MSIWGGCMNYMNVVEKEVNANKNRNTRFVRVNETRVCKCCGKSILKGTKCLTLNKKGVGRQWQCMKCTMDELSLDKAGTNYTCEVYRNIVEIKVELNNVSFGDEGGYMALSDCLDENIARCIDCGKCSFADTL